MPEFCQFSLGFIAVGFDEDTKGFPIDNSMAVSSLITHRRRQAACGGAPLQLAIETVPTDIEHRDDFRFWNSSVNSGNRFFS
jgi:hypothetical protein